MDTKRIIAELEEERDRLNAAIGALGHSADGNVKRRKRHLSAEARRRISEAQTKRWAKLKRANKRA